MTVPTQAAVDLRGVTKKFGAVTAVDTSRCGSSWVR